MLNSHKKVIPVYDKREYNTKYHPSAAVLIMLARVYNSMLIGGSLYI